MFIFHNRHSQLDGPKAGTNLSGVKEEEDEEKDFYANANDCPIHPDMGAKGLAQYVSTSFLFL